MTIKKPFEETYQIFTNDARYSAKDYSLVPEFRISEHIGTYLDNSNFLSQNDNIFTVTGSAVSASGDVNFVQNFLVSEKLKYYDKLREEHKEIAKPSKIDLTCHTTIKLIPYEGFYPVERTLQLTQLFSQSYGTGISSSIDAGSPYRMRPIVQPLFGPGILYNSIKSGIAVSHPVAISPFTHITAKQNDDMDRSTEITQIRTRLRASYDPLENVTFVGIGRASSWAFQAPIPEVSNFEKIPFEAILDPGVYLKKDLYDINSFSSSSANITSSITSFDKKYKLAANNFFASSIDFFMKNSQLNTIISQDDNDTNYFKMQLKKRYKMRVVLRASEKYDFADFYGTTLIETAFSNPVTLSGSHRASVLNFSMYDRPNLDVDDLDPPSGQGDGTWNDLIQPPDKYRHGGSAFGPIMAGSTVADHDGYLTDIDGIADYGFACYDYYTPCYYDGFAYVDYDFKPYDASGNESDTDDRFRFFTLQEILSNVTASYYRFSSTPLLDYIGTHWPDDSSAIAGRKIDAGEPTDYRFDSFHSRHWLKNNIQDSVTLEGVLKGKEIEYDQFGNVLAVRDDSDVGAKWFIQPKLELPIFDYQNISIEKPASGSENAGRGIWHQYGEDTAPGEGLVLQVQDWPNRHIRPQKPAGPIANAGSGDTSAEDADPLTPTISTTDPDSIGSLADVVGFSKDPVDLCQLAEKRIIEEAVVAIPFYDTARGRKYFGIKQELLDAAKAGSQNVGPALRNTINVMPKYVIPPKFDFLTFDGSSGSPKVDPIAMFFFEFKMELTREDLKRIWHNVAPEPQLKQVSVTIGNEFSENEMLPFYSEKIRWQIFKVKKKAEWDYSNKVLASREDSRFRFRTKGTDLFSIPEYSYNWPYDFCTIIEMAKIESGIHIETNDETQRRRSKNSAIRQPGQSQPRKLTSTNEKLTLRPVFELEEFEPVESIPEQTFQTFNQPDAALILDDPQFHGGITGDTTSGDTTGGTSTTSTGGDTTGGTSTTSTGNEVIPAESPDFNLGNPPPPDFTGGDTTGGDTVPPEEEGPAPGDQDLSDSAGFGLGDLGGFGGSDDDGTPTT